MVDHARLSRVLSDFAHTLIRRYEVGEVIYQLTDRTVEALGVAGAGASLHSDGGKLLFVQRHRRGDGEGRAVQEDAQDGHQLGGQARELSRPAG